MTRAPVHVYPIRPQDVPDALALVSEVLGEFGLRFGEGSATDAELASLPASYETCGGAFWVARSDARLLGTCGVMPIATATYELRKMYLSPAARGLGVGKQMLDAAVEWVCARGGYRMVLDTAEQMTRAIAFYEANGFIRDDSQIRGARCTRGYVRDLTRT
jgi:putative acetyltransferase